jgi:hypothetical protein
VAAAFNDREAAADLAPATSRDPAAERRALAEDSIDPAAEIHVRAEAPEDDLHQVTLAISSEWDGRCAQAAAEQPPCPASYPAREVALAEGALAPARAAAGSSDPAAAIVPARAAAELNARGEGGIDLAAERAPAKAAGEFNDQATVPVAAV